MMAYIEVDDDATEWLNSISQGTYLLNRYKQKKVEYVFVYLSVP
jgi:hypothetical protein